MNANELAKKLEKTGWVSPLTETECFKIATMLRQLQAEKEALKSGGEPVAWINRDEKEGWLNWDKNTAMPINIPLYTHPAQELNDGGEPVKNATYWKRQHDRLLMNLNVSAIKIAELEKELAILRKAQEK